MPFPEMATWNFDSDSLAYPPHHRCAPFSSEAIELFFVYFLSFFLRVITTNLKFLQLLAYLPSIAHVG
jgi:hypothetical protein